MPNDAAIIEFLCLRAGMLMEDISAFAISRLPHDPDARRCKLQHLARAGQDICQLLAAAEIITRSSDMGPPDPT